ncbi:phage major tail tube protein [Aeromonas sanarellii]|nr:phage major tail tube protein [Aeromonas sanarellii]
MKLKHAWIAGALALCTHPLIQAAQVTTNVAVTPGQASLAEELTAEATVTAIDLASRKVSLKNAEGKAFDLVAGEEVANLQNLKVGDVVALRYLQLLDLTLLKGTAGVRKRVVEVEGGKAAPGEQPAAGAGMQVTIYADVIDVDKAQQTIRVKGVDHTLTLKVQDPAQFALIAKGDQIKAVQTTAIAIGIAPQSP